MRPMDEIFQIKIPAYEIRRGENARQYTSYKVVTRSSTSGEIVGVVWRRFTDFVSLNRKLERLGFDPFELPRKRFLTSSRSPFVIEKRRKTFEKALNHVVNTLLCTEPVTTFLGLNGSSSSFLQTPSKNNVCDNIDSENSPLGEGVDEAKGRNEVLLHTNDASPRKVLKGALEKKISLTLSLQVSLTLGEDGSVKNVFAHVDNTMVNENKDESSALSTLLKSNDEIKTEEEVKSALVDCNVQVNNSMTFEDEDGRVWKRCGLQVPAPVKEDVKGGRAVELSYECGSLADFVKKNPLQSREDEQKKWEKEYKNLLENNKNLVVEKKFLKDCEEEEGRKNKSCWYRNRVIILVLMVCVVWTSMMYMAWFVLPKYRTPRQNEDPRRKFFFRYSILGRFIYGKPPSYYEAAGIPDPAWLPEPKNFSNEL
eukprot:g1701.t1